MREATVGWQGRALAGWMDVVRRRAGLVVAASLALTAASLAHSLKTLSVNTGTTEMISPEVPFRRNDTAFKKAFPLLKDTIVIVIDGVTPERAGEAAGRLGGRLKKNARFRSVYIPGTGPFFRRSGLLFLDADELSRLADRMAAAEPLLAALASDPTLRGFAKVLDEALESREEFDPAELAALLGRMADVAGAERAGRPLNLSWQSLLGASPEGMSGARRFVLAQPILDYESMKPAAAALAGIRRAAAQLGIDAGHGLRMRITGSPALDQEELESVELGGKTASLLSLLLVSILLVAGLRSVRLVLATVATLVMGLIWTAAFAAVAIGQLNLISVAFAVLFIGLGVDFGIHMSLRYREEAAGGAEPAAALRRAGGGVGGALGLSAVSAAAGFYAFLPTDYQGLAELGLIAGTGMFIALAANLTVLPALLALAPPRIPSARRPGGTPPLAHLARKRGRAILAGALVLGVIGAAAVPYVRFDFNPMNLKDPQAESVATFLDISRRPGSSLYTADVLTDGLEASRRISARLAALPEVEKTISLTSFVPADQERKLKIIDDMAIFLTPLLSARAEVSPLGPSARRKALDRLRARLAVVAGRRGPLREPAARLEAELGKLAEESAAVAGLERRLTAYLPGIFERLHAALSAGPVSLADLPPDLRGRWVSKTGKVRVQVHPAKEITGNRALRRFAEAVQSAAPDATGVPIIVTGAGEAVVSAFKEASAIALVAIAAILLIVLRRPADILLVLAPLFLAAVLTVAVMVLLGLSFNFANIIVLPLLLGLGVSSGIHLVMRQREEKESARVLASSTPRGVLFSGLTTIAAFGSLAFSGHRGMTSMGLLLAIAISFTLIAALVVLPSLAAAAAPRLDGGGKRA